MSWLFKTIKQKTWNINILKFLNIFKKLILYFKKSYQQEIVKRAPLRALRWTALLYCILMCLQSKFNGVWNMIYITQNSIIRTSSHLKVCVIKVFYCIYSHFFLISYMDYFEIIKAKLWGFFAAFAVYYQWFFFS